MKVLQIGNCHYRRGGAEVVYFNTAGLLREKGHQVSFFSMHQADNFPSEFSDFFVNQHDYRRLSFLRKVANAPAYVYNREAYDKLRLLLREVRPDVAHLHLFLGGLTSSILRALREFQVPIVCSVHDYRLICPAYRLMNGSDIICEKCRDRFYFRCLTKRCSEKNGFQSAMLSMDAYFRKYVVNPLNYVSHYLFVSDFIRRKHIDFDSKYGKAQSLLYNFVPGLDFIEPVRRKGDYFLFYGRLSSEKGVQTLVDSALRTGVRLKVVGTGPLIERCKGMEKGAVQFLGYKSGEELWDLVKGASFVVVPSEWYENNPLTVLEAYARGKPVIGSRIGGIPEIIEDGRTGFLFEAGNGRHMDETLLKAAGCTGAEYGGMSERARQFANTHFHPEMHYRDLMKIYEEIAR